MLTWRLGQEAKYQDEYREALQALIEAKIAGQEVRWRRE
jgi:non-homologous end joining protein Ku